VVGVDADAEYLDAHPFNLPDTGFGGCFAVGLSICNEQDELSFFWLGQELFRHPPQSLGQRCRAMRADVELVCDALSMSNQRADRDVVEMLLNGWKGGHSYIDPSHGRQC